MINHDVGNNLGTLVIRPFKAYSLRAELYFSISLYILNLVQTAFILKVPFWSILSEQSFLLV